MKFILKHAATVKLILFILLVPTISGLAAGLQEDRTTLQEVAFNLSVVMTMIYMFVCMVVFSTIKTKKVEEIIVEKEEVVVDPEPIDYKSVGLINKYIITKTNGTEVSPDADYFILRLDDNQRDPKHRIACIKAIRIYAKSIQHTLPLLARDLIKKYGHEGEPINTAVRR